jgi:ferredoxin-NADP reductase
MRVTELIALGGETDDDEKAIILRVKKPVTFGYVPGQYASIRVSGIDMHWHPFSIGSEPSQPCLEFYMMVSTSSNKTWTAQLWDIAKAAKTPTDLPFTTVDVLGPYGTCINTSSHMHLCAIGGGTGIVSMLSTLKATVNLLCQINPRYHADAEAGLRESAKELVVQRKEISKSFRHMTRRSLSTKDSTTAVQPCDVEQALGGALEMIDKDDNSFETPDKSRSTSKNKSKTPPAARSKHNNMSGEKIRRGSSAGLTSSMTANGAVNTDLLRTRMHKLWFKEVMKLLFLLAPVWELLMSGLTLSWHNETHPITEEMMYFLKAGTIVCAVNFGVIFLASFEALFFEAWVDILFVGISIFSTLWWCEHKSWGNFNHLQVCAFLGLSAYRGLRTWTVANSSLNDSIQSQVAKLGVSSLVSISSMELVWVCRDASLVEFLWPEIDTYWTKLKATWGNRAGDVVTIKIYVTSTDVTARKRLERSLRDTALFETGALKFGRPDIFDTVQNQLLNRVKDDANAGGVSAASSTLVAFCGSPSLGSVVGREVMNVQIIAEATKHGHHTMTFYQENYGIAPTKKKSAYEEGEVGVVKALNETEVTSTTLEGANGHNKDSGTNEGRNGSEHVYQSCQVKGDGGNDDDDVSDDGIEINGIEIDLGLDDVLEGANSKKQSPKSGMEFY